MRKWKSFRSRTVSAFSRFGMVKDPVMMKCNCFANVNYECDEYDEYEYDDDDDDDDDDDNTEL